MLVGVVAGGVGVAGGGFAVSVVSCYLSWQRPDSSKACLCIVHFYVPFLEDAL